VKRLESERCRVCGCIVNINEYHKIREFKGLTYNKICGDIECCKKLFEKETKFEVKELDEKVLTELIIFEDIWKDLDEENWFVNYRSLIEDLQDVKDFDE